MREFGVDAKQARVVGGGAQNKLWRRILADCLQLPLMCPSEPETAALGGALQAAAVHQGVPIGEFIADLALHAADEQSRLEPDPSLEARYLESYATHIEVGQRLFEGPWL